MGARLIAKSGGLIEVGITQATVVMFGLAAFPTHETSAVCIGWRSLYAELMLTLVFTDIFFTYFYELPTLSSLFSFAWAHSKS